MARIFVTQVTSICTVLSFFYISQSLERHSLTDSPRLSSFLVFLLSGAICYGASCFTKLLPGADGRFTSPRGSHNAPLLDVAGNEWHNKQNHYAPKRPRRLSLPALVICIVLRLEIFHRVNYQQQCSTPGVESFLCLVLLAYEIFATRRKWGFPVADDPDDPWRSCFDDICDWFSGPRVVLTIAVTSAIMFTIGTFYSVSQGMRSTYVCFGPSESRQTTLLLQCLGLLLDAVIVVLLWRTLAWLRTAKLRLRMLGTILVLSAFYMSLLWLGHRLFIGSSILHPGFGFLYGFDIIVDSFAFATLMISATSWTCETSPLTPSSILTWLVGTVKACDNIFHFGDWLHPSRAAAVVPLYFIGGGMVIFTYCHELRSVFFLHRLFLTALIFGLTVGTTVFILLEQPQIFEKRHPINDFIFKARVKQDRWFTHATFSGSLPVAVNVYKERHDGRDPPPGFSEWYAYAQDTIVIDHFVQIESDMRPFKVFSPKNLRKRITQVAGLPGVQTITIKDGKASIPTSVNRENTEDLQLLVAMINKFSQSLPDMILPINPGSTPRILPSWEDANGQGHSDLTPIANLISRTPVEELNKTEKSVDAGNIPAVTELSRRLSTTASDYRQMQIAACPPGSRARTSPRWNIGEFCTSCIRRHSRGPLLVNWERSLEFCSQADMKYLHGMSLAPPHAEPIQALLPLFGPSKTEPFQDIMIPIPRAHKDVPDLKWEFRRRYDTLFWRGQLGDGSLNGQILRGSPKLRLLSMMSNPNPKGQVNMVLPVDGSPDNYIYETVSASEANSAISMSMGISNYSGCLGLNCELVRELYGERDVQEPLEYRYVLVVDDDDGPPSEFLRTLRSQSVPFLASMFRTWYTERLMPWVHFVPIDLRYQALHTTFSYFTGTPKQTQVNGRDIKMSARSNDAKWIALQGKKWAETVLGEKDMEVYLFRLLLEWGRLIDEKRDEIGFRTDSKGGYINDNWTRNQEW
ncbi:hypothetical protein EDB81DRAFT_881954 [Dactylonectria macrodidyma]|uniref:Glycosyl transferase CAP10 domain-containing protein n=1 Tax=Dactylonectria macrodidyma TaxID=307937 RepID=A0A9P9F3K6_9HYPO|nr:hypothetical protein EDB81DRAFT_881954 [Dactylonectria macrodidyma]